MGGGDGGTSYDLRWVLGPYRCLLVRLSSRVGLVASNASTFLPTQTLRGPFSPTDPPIALQSIARDVRLAHASTA